MNKIINYLDSKRFQSNLVKFFKHFLLMFQGQRSIVFLKEKRYICYRLHSHVMIRTLHLIVNLGRSYITIYTEWRPGAQWVQLNKKKLHIDFKGIINILNKWTNINICEGKTTFLFNYLLFWLFLRHIIFNPPLFFKTIKARFKRAAVCPLL